MDIGLAMSTHGLLTRDERDFFLQRLEADAMRPVQLAQLAERLGYHSLWFSDHVCMGRDLGAKHTANKSGTRAYIESLGFKIVANFGDQFSDLLGGYAVKTFKMPNPNYYLP